MIDQVVLLTAPGDVAQFQIDRQTVVAPKAGEITIRHEMIGTNFVDIYHRRGLYPLPSYPAMIGVEAAGIVELVGEGVEGFRVGDRVAHAGPPVGSYCSLRTLPANRVIHLPDAVSTRTAAASLLKGMTAFMLLQKSYRVSAGDIVLVQAAAGGLGSVLVRSAKALGATVIGTVSSAEKAELAKSYGADHVIIGRGADVVSAVRQLTDGQGVHVATMASVVICF